MISGTWKLIKEEILERANILKRHPEVLSGDTSRFEEKRRFTELKIQVYGRDENGNVRKNGIKKVKSLSELNTLERQRGNYLARLLTRIKSIFPYSFLRQYELPIAYRLL